jgi:hypothetical protein
VNLKNITATCCGASINAPGRAVECPTCHAVYQVRDTDDGRIVLTTTPSRMSPRMSWWRTLLSRLPIVGRRYRQDANVHLEID